MIRGLALVAGLLLGLAVAVAVFGRLAHLRAVADLPQWTRAIDGDATAIAGGGDGAAGMRVSWRLAGLDAQGLFWRLRVDGPGTALTLIARPDLSGRHLRLTDVAGAATLTGPAFSGHFPRLAGTGRIEAGGLWLDLNAPGQRLRRDGQDLPDGPVTLTLSPDGWELALAGQGGSQTGTDLNNLLGE